MNAEKGVRVMVVSFLRGRRTAVVVTVIALAWACGGEGESDSNDPAQDNRPSDSIVDEDEFAANEQSESEAIPSTDDMASMLLAPEDLGAWPGMVSHVEVSEVVTDEMRDSLPGWELCPDASEAAQAAADAVEWDAFMVQALVSRDSTWPPDEHTVQTIYLQQFLTATDPADPAATFDLLAQGANECLLALEEASEKGQPFEAQRLTADTERYTAEPIDDVDLGDDSFGALTHSYDKVYESVEIQMYEVVVRKGSLLMFLIVSDIRADGSVEPYFTTDAVIDIAETAVDKL